ncbi:MAG TPA: flagellar protein FlgN [Nitrospiraceae bacterium]|nr:flagellar protein FlgN [Nitrospiraceae bacterium]
MSFAPATEPITMLLSLLDQEITELEVLADLVLEERRALSRCSIFSLDGIAQRRLHAVHQLEQLEILRAQLADRLAQEQGFPPGREGLRGLADRLGGQVGDRLHAAGRRLTDLVEEVRGGMAVNQLALSGLREHAENALRLWQDSGDLSLYSASGVRKAAVSEARVVAHKG